MNATTTPAPDPSPRLLAALRGVLSRLPTPWGDHVMNGHIALIIPADAVDEALSAIDAATPKPEPTSIARFACGLMLDDEVEL